MLESMLQLRMAALAGDTMNSAMWHPEPASDIDDGEVHVWLADLASLALQIDRLGIVLSADEIERSRHFHFERDQRRFIASHGVLRRILARYLKRPAAEIQFERGAHGKPCLRIRGGERPLHFNLSHSKDRALIGVCADGRVGVDIEFRDRDRANTEVAQRFFAPEEVAALLPLPPEAQRDAFFATWTMKEAYIKARGEGISLGLSTFAITVNGTPALTRSDHGADEIERWRFWKLEAGPDYAVAVAAEESGSVRCLKAYRFSAIT